MLLLFSTKVAEQQPVWERLFIRFTVHVFHESLSVCMSASFPFGFEGGMWDLILLVPDYCLSTNFSLTQLSWSHLCCCYTLPV